MKTSIERLMRVSGWSPDYLMARLTASCGFSDARWRTWEFRRLLHDVREAVRRLPPDAPHEVFVAAMYQSQWEHDIDVVMGMPPGNLHLTGTCAPGILWVDPSRARGYVYTESGGLSPAEALMYIEILWHAAPTFFEDGR